MTNSSLLDPKEKKLETSALSANPLLGRQLKRLFVYIKAQAYEGFDPFDGLNSRLFKALPFSRSQLCRLALLQFCKQSPVNLRPLLMVPKGFNPKGGALFLLGNLNLFRQTGELRFAEESHTLFQRLKAIKIARPQGNGWGYNFDWQARAFHVPVGTPNLVTSVYVGKALLAYYDCFGDPEALTLAKGISQFIRFDMVKFENDQHLCFNYIPGRDAEVHNANLLAAAYLSQTQPYFEVLDPHLTKQILKSVRFSANDINPDGSWPYGTKSFHRWVDNFHTAFNIECLITIIRNLETSEFDATLEQVLSYYLRELFSEEGDPKYYNNRLYPVDVHVLAQSIVLINLLRHYTPTDAQKERMQVIERRLAEMTAEFQDPQGYFYYQRLSWGWNRIPYMRWGQAWMFYALSGCL